MANERTFPPRSEFPTKPRHTTTSLPTKASASLRDLQSQFKPAPWNRKGTEFSALHVLFDTLAGEVSAHVDEIAERLTALGGFAFGTVRMAAAHSKLPEMDVELTSGPEYVKALADRYGLVANSTRKAIDTTDEAGDANTADLFTGISRDLDKRLWFLEAHLIK